MLSDVSDIQLPANWIGALILVLALVVCLLLDRWRRAARKQRETRDALEAYKLRTRQRQPVDVGQSVGAALVAPDPAERCANCGRAIGKLEAPAVWRENVVCDACHEILERQEHRAIK